MNIVMMREIHLLKASGYTEIAHGMGYDKWKWVSEDNVVKLTLKID